MILVKAIVVVVFAIFFSACGAEQGVKNKIAMPYYSDCDGRIEEYINSLNSSGYKLRYEIQKFNRVYEAHESILGVLYLESHSDDFDTKAVEKGIETLCFPTAYRQIPNDELGFRSLNNELKTNQYHGKKSNFVVIRGDTIFLYQKND